MQEITPSEGYLLDETMYPVGAEPGQYEVEFNSAPAVTSPETVQKGKITIIKHCDDGSTQIETPEVGAEFAVFLESSGSYENAKDSKRDYLICDENGYAETRLLPYGVYTVRQTKGWDGRELMKDFDVFINKDGGVYRHLINNAPFTSYVKVIKTDAETGKAIPYAGAGFQIYDPNGQLDTMQFTYPAVTEINTFYTTTDGTLITPEVLPYGTGYSLVEVQAPYGYVLNSEPVYFDINPDNSTEESAVTVVEVERPNMPQKGKISIIKLGEVFSSVTALGGVAIDEDGNEVEFPTSYQPVYEETALAGAVYEVTAAEDIITPDGTLRYSAGEVVSTLTTAQDSHHDGCHHKSFAALDAKLGKLKSVAFQSWRPTFGTVLDAETHVVELTYAGQEVEITEAGTTLHDDRQKIKISLDKVLEQNENFGIGMNGEITTVQFELYASEDITAADGSSIPADGLMETYMKMLGGYGKAARPETIALRQNHNASGPSEDIAKLAGARAVNISEPDKQMVLSAALVKTLTGNDTMSARFLNENSFEFKPQFKLFINTNHLPKANDVTIFSSGRVKVLPFNRHFDPEEQDKTLKKRLEKELSGVLNWCLDGLWLMRETGFEPPRSVQNATAQYQHDSDKLTRFVEEMLTPDPEGEVRTEDIYREYRDWCTQNGQYADAYPTFKQGMEGYAQVRKKRPRGAGKSVNPTAMFCGVQLKMDRAFTRQT